jgi:hypothetical protein
MRETVERGPQEGGHRENLDVSKRRVIGTTLIFAMPIRDADIVHGGRS